MWTRTLRPVVIFLLGMTLLAACTQAPLPETGSTTTTETLEATPHTPMPASDQPITPTHLTETNGGSPLEHEGQALPTASCQGPHEHGGGAGTPDHPQGQGPQRHQYGKEAHDGGPCPDAGPNNPWRQFHQQPIPQTFADLENPIPPDEDSLAKGQALYEAQCASCHGETGMGDGPAAASLNPPPAPIARTACRMSDAYLFWRIAEGGAQWGTAMPAFGNTLSEEDIWHLVNYIRSLGACP